MDWLQNDCDVWFRITSGCSRKWTGISLMLWKLAAQNTVRCDNTRRSSLKNITEKNQL